MINKMAKRILVGLLTATLAIGGDCGLSDNQVYAAENCDRITCAINVNTQSASYIKVFALNKTVNSAKCNHKYKRETLVKSTCSKKGYKILKCKQCKATKKVTLKKKKHSYEYAKTEYPTYDAYSYKVYKCTKCGTTKKTKIENPGSGYVGTLEVKSVGLQVKVYNVHQTEPYTDSQTITDRKDSACMLELDGQVFIADHKNQGFDKIKQVTAGKTVATLGGKKYRCVKKFNGRNEISQLVDNDGTNVTKYGADIVMYTCNQDWRHVTITLWNEVN